MCLSLGGPTSVTISGEIKLFKTINAFAIFRVDLLEGINCLASCKEINLFNGKILLEQAKTNVKSKGFNPGLSGPSLSMILPGIKDVTNIKEIINKIEFTANVSLKIFGIKFETIIEINPNQFYVKVGSGFKLFGIDSDIEGNILINEDTFDFNV